MSHSFRKKTKRSRDPRTVAGLLAYYALERISFSASQSWKGTGKSELNREKNNCIQLISGGDVKKVKNKNDTKDSESMKIGKP